MTSTPTEAQIQDAIRLELGDVAKYPELIVWRNNVGVLTDKNGRHVRFGVANPGGADLIGIFAGIFIAAEIKTPTGKQTEEQRRFEDLIVGKGGEDVVLRSGEDARQWVAELRRKYA